jgi:6-phosphogluconolactonase (cycloisomerase 2 family)
MSSATVASVVGINSITIDPSGKYAYGASANDKTIRLFSIGADGGLTAMATPSVAAGTNPSWVSVVGTWQ